MNVLRSRWFYSLCAALLLGAAWWRSYDSHFTLWIYGDSGRVMLISSCGGQTHLFLTDMHAGAQRSWSLDWFSIPADEDWGVDQDIRMHHRLLENPEVTTHGGFGYVHAKHGDLFLTSATGLLFIVPHWLWILLLSIIPARVARRALRSNRRHNRGLCVACGYDLRATPDRCPECGTARPA